MRPGARRGVRAGIAVLFGAAVAFSLAYGPARRTYVSAPQVVALRSPGELAETWARSGARGRIGILYSRYLNASATMDPGPVLATERSMEHGILRRVLHVLPDRSWPEIDRRLSGRDDMRREPDGYDWISTDVRVHIAPLSRFAPEAEPALVVVEPSVWTPEELEAIADKVRKGVVRSDLIVVMRGSDAETEVFRRALAAAPR